MPVFRKDGALRPCKHLRLMQQTAAKLKASETDSSGESMIDWSQPRSLSKVTEDAGFTMSDVAFVSGLDESTVSRLWDDPRWLDSVSGRSLQSLAASVPGVAEYFASHSVLARRNALVKQLEAEGLVVNRPALASSAVADVPHQYLINALEAALSIMRGDERRACSYLARFWGLQQNRGTGISVRHRR